MAGSGPAASCGWPASASAASGTVDMRPPMLAWPMLVIPT